MTISIGIIVFDGVLTAEVIGPAEVFGIAKRIDDQFDATVQLININDNPTVTTEEGIVLTGDASIHDSLQLDVLIVPGGLDVSHLLDNEALNAFIQQHQTSAAWISSICAGAFVLGNAGVLDDKQATTWFGGEKDLQTDFPAINVQFDQPIVVDHRRLTANGGLVSYQAALVLLGKLTSNVLAKQVYQSLGLARLEAWSVLEQQISLEIGV